MRGSVRAGIDVDAKLLGPDPKNVAVLQKNCVACHQQIVGGINTHPGDPQKMLDCLHCHREVGHGPVR